MVCGQTLFQNMFSPRRHTASAPRRRFPPAPPAAAPPPRAPAAAHSLKQWSMPSLSFLERANQSRYIFQFNRFSSRVSSFQLLSWFDSVQFMPLQRTQAMPRTRYVLASGKCPLHEFASSIVGFDPSAAALTAHAAPLRCTCFKFALFAVIMFPGLETASKGFQTTQLRKPIRIRQNTPLLPIQILLVSLILFELL